MSICAKLSCKAGRHFDTHQHEKRTKTSPNRLYANSMHINPKNSRSALGCHEHLPAIITNIFKKTSVNKERASHTYQCCALTLPRERARPVQKCARALHDHPNGDFTRIVTKSVRKSNRRSHPITHTCCHDKVKETSK